MTKARWQLAAGLLTAMFTTGMASADAPQLNPDAVNDIKGLISYMATELPVVQGQQSTAMQRNSIENIARPLDDVLDGCYGPPNIADYAIALHVGLQNAVRTHSDALYISKAEAQFNELTAHIQDAAQWIPYIDQTFAAEHPNAQNLMDRLDAQGVLPESDTYITLEGVAAHDFPETQTYRIENVHNAPLQYFGPFSSMMNVSEFHKDVSRMIDATNKGNTAQFWDNVPHIPADNPRCGN